MRKRRLLGLFGYAISLLGVGCSLLLSSDLENGQANPTNGIEAGSSGCVGPGCVDGTSSGSTDGPVNPPNDAADTGSLSNPPCPTFAFFCEDFESGNFSKWSVVENNGATISIDNTNAHAGMRSAHARSNINPTVDGSTPSDMAVIQAPLNTAKKSGALMVVRIYVHMPKQLTGDTTILKWTAVGSDDMNLKIDGTGAFLVDTDHPQAGPELLASAAPPINKWFCLEWRVTVGVQGHQTVLLDGQTILDADENTLTAPGYNSLTVGFTAASGKFDQEVLFDDIAIADEAIGCF